MLDKLLPLVFMFAIGVMFYQLCKVGRDNVIRTLCLIFEIFGTATVYGYFFEIGVVDAAWLKLGILILLVGASCWTLMDRRYY